MTLGKAVPPGREVPALIYQLSQATNQRHVEFASIVNGATSGSGSTSGSSSSSASAAAAPLAGFTQMPFTFTFKGGFFDLYHLFHELDGFVMRKASGDLQVRGRLLTIQSVKLDPASESAGSAKAGSEDLTGTITAAAYVLPGTQGLTGGGTPASPGAASPTSSVAASASATSPTAPAVVSVAP